MISLSFISQTSESGVVPLMTPFREPRFFFGDTAMTGSDGLTEGLDSGDEPDANGNFFWFGPEPQISLLPVVHLLGDQHTFTTGENET